ncbi:SMP-30/gluconolactonase/LRE family protein [Thalassolituus sp. LLYu03]|uniref:SMP-30/gluconolactonase/LRE family protein n=1 Tax=Thalassolituus sp. LLYu03 TaxID=3421656 RepID=UPI003D29D5F3
MKFLLSLFLLILIIAAALVAMPSPIDSVAVSVSRPLPFAGALTVNDALQSTQLIALPEGKRGGEDVARDQLGCLYTGTLDGSIMRKCAYSGWETLVNTGGRPLGLHFDAQQNLIIADAEKGLLSMSPQGNLRVLADQFKGKHLGVVDDVDIGADGTIYFSDASNRYPLSDIVLDVLDGRPSGRLFALNPADNSLTLLADELAFANGVAVSADQSYVLINETFTYRISKVWLSGPKAGEKEVLLDKLPGMPDGIARAANGTYWVAMYGLRPKIVDQFHDQPWVKNLLAKLPKEIAPVPKPYGLILQIDENGMILQSLHDQAAVAIGEVTSVQPEDNGLYLGTLHMGVIGKLAY